MKNNSTNYAGEFQHIICRTFCHDNRTIPCKHCPMNKMSYYKRPMRELFIIRDKSVRLAGGRRFL